MTAPMPGLAVRLTRFLLCSTAVAVIWVGVLPQVAKLEPVERHIQRMNDAHIDAGVMFYSELDARVIPDQGRINEILRSHGARPLKKD